MSNPLIGERRSRVSHATVEAIGERLRAEGQWVPEQGGKRAVSWAAVVFCSKWRRLPREALFHKAAERFGIEVTYMDRR